MMKRQSKNLNVHLFLLNPKHERQKEADGENKQQELLNGLFSLRIGKN